jgi:hypothetical protein
MTKFFTVIDDDHKEVAVFWKRADAALFAWGRNVDCAANALTVVETAI